MNRNDAEGFRLIAHRGASALAPENTRAAFRRARKLGVTEVETDVRLTRDQQVVLFHDPTLLGKFGRDVPVETVTLAELEAMDIGSWFVEDGYMALNGSGAGWDEGELQRTSGGCVMGLDSYLKEFGFDFYHHIEIKGETRELPNATLEVLEKRGVLDRCTFTSFNLKQLERLRAIDEECRAGWLFPRYGDPTPDPAQSIRKCLALGLQECNPRFDLLTAEYVRRIHAEGLVVRTFGIRKPDDLWRAIETGADGATVNWVRSANELVSKFLQQS